MKIEIESAANFLQNLLRLHSSELIVDRLEVFREALLNALTLHYKEHWFPDRPFKGSGYRCLRINHKMDPVITKAGLTCGLDESSLKSLLPNELTLWIDPKEVSYRIGENGSICVLYDADNHVTKPEASREGIPRSTPTKKLPSSLEDGQMISRANNCSPTNSSLSSTPSSLSSPSTSSSPDWCLRDNSSPVSANHQIASTTIQSVTPSTTLKMNPSEVRYTADNHNLNFVINSSMSVNPNQATVVAAVAPSTPIAAAPPPPSSISTVTVNSNTNCRPASANTASNLNHWTYAYHWQPSSRIENYGSYHHQTAQYPIHQNRRPTCQQSIQIGHTAQTQLHHNKSPTSYTGYTSWDNFIFDKGVTSRHTAYHALNTNIEQLSAYVSG